MSERRRWGIRAKLLVFYAVVLAAAAALNLYVQLTAFRAVSAFEDRLSRYHAVHRFKIAFDDHFSRTERQLREGSIPDTETINREFAALSGLYAIIAVGESESLNAYFNAQATGYGVDAYKKNIAAAISRRAAGEKDWYLDVATAERLVAYVDGYLSILLSEALEAGDERYRSVASGAIRVRNLSLMALAALAAVLGFFAWAFSASIANPIRTLAQASARMAAGDLSVGEVKAGSGAEVEVLTRSFNAMCLSIRGMVDDLRDKADLEKQLREEERELMEKERLLHDAQFQALQDQIRPHFLFNALNTIARTALFENAGETERLALALAKLLRYSLGPASSLVTIREEVSILSEYLSFQALRFGERLVWDLSVDSRAEDVLIPRFTLQPLVENAVRHGVEPMESGGRVLVRVNRRGGRVTVSVEDSGVGMAPECVKRLLGGVASYRSSSHRPTGGEETGIGVANVLERLRLRYSGQERVSIHSAVGGGTSFRISFPISIEAVS